MRGTARGYHTVARAWSLICLSIVLSGALLLLNASYGPTDHDPILVMRLLRPILVSFISIKHETTSSIQAADHFCLWPCLQFIRLGSEQNTVAANF